MEKSKGNREAAMNPTEYRAALSLASIFSLRMLGLFMIYPVFAVYAKELSGATEVTIGVALGIYGLTQALFQIPFGMLSDRLGRKPVITAGLLIFALGSAVAGSSRSIYGVIAGRTLQGAGAVGSVILALGADLTREEHRTKAMALIGMTIGFSFAVALVVGPIFNAWVGVSGIFWITAVLAVAGIVVLQAVVPQPIHTHLHRDTEAVPAMFRRVLKDPELVRLDFGIFSMHAMLTASFLVLPGILKDSLGLSPAHEWFFYLPVLAVSVFLMVPPIIIAEKHRRMKEVFLSAIAVLGLSQLAFLEWHGHLWPLAIILTIFFGAFNLMEASLPSLISKVAPAESKGTAMGVYSSSQFFGIFVGGALGGWIQQHGGVSGVFGLSLGVAVVWFVIAVGMRPPKYLTSRLLRVGVLPSAEAHGLESKLLEVKGVAEATVVPDEGVAYLKVDSKLVDEAVLEGFSKAEE